MSLVILRTCNIVNIAYRNPDICFCYVVLHAGYSVVSSASAGTSHRIHNAAVLREKADPSASECTSQKIVCITAPATGV
jgi:hypothetical protein